MNIRNSIFASFICVLLGSLSIGCATAKPVAHVSPVVQVASSFPALDKPIVVNQCVFTYMDGSQPVVIVVYTDEDGDLSYKKASIEPELLAKLLRTFDEALRVQGVDRNTTQLVCAPVNPKALPKKKLPNTTPKSPNTPTKPQTPEPALPPGLSVSNN